MHLALACALLAAPPALVDVTHAMDDATLPAVAPQLRPATAPALTVSLVDAVRPPRS